MKVKLNLLLFMLGAILLVGTVAYSQPSNLSILVFASADDAFVNNWVSTPYEQPQNILRIKTAKRGQWVYVGFVVSGVQPDKNQEINYEVDVAIVDPNGHKIYSKEAYAKSIGQKSERNGVILVNPTFRFEADATDPTGKYTFQATVRDLNAKKSSSGEWAVNITAN